jgi:hypothetical protein
MSDLSYRSKQEPYAQISSNLDVPRKSSIKFHWNSNFRSFSEFLFKFHFKSGEVPIRKVLPYLKSFTTIFYFKNFEPEKVTFGMNQFWINLICQFQIRIVFFFFFSFPDRAWLSAPDHSLARAAHLCHARATTVSDLHRLRYVIGSPLPFIPPPGMHRTGPPPSFSSPPRRHKTVWWYLNFPWTGAPLKMKDQPSRTSHEDVGSNK